MTANTDRQLGMSLVEALVGILLLSLVFIAFFSMLDMSARVAKSQGNISDATENLRFSVAALVKNVRMAGTGGVPLVYDGGSGLTPLALEVDDNVSATNIGGRTTLANTDVLTVRGVITGELYDIGQAAVNSPPSQVVVTRIDPFAPATLQDLSMPSTPVGSLLLIGLQRPLNVQSTTIPGVRKYSQYRVVSVTDASFDSATPPTTMTISFNGSAAAASSLNWGGSYTTFTNTDAFATGFLDRLQFFIANNDAGEPTLYRFHGTGSAEELVPNVSNLQVALGCDLNQNGLVEDSEWFLSKAHPGAPTGDQMITLSEVRLSVVARAQDPDMNYTEPQTGQPENGVSLTSAALRYRHRTITVRVALRSHPVLEAT